MAAVLMNQSSATAWQLTYFECLGPGCRGSRGSTAGIRRRNLRTSLRSFLAAAVEPALGSAEVLPDLGDSDQRAPTFMHIYGAPVDFL